MIYVIRCGRDYICKGSYVVQGEKYKVIGSIEEARKFKTEDAAQREAERLNNSYKYENISDDCVVVKICDYYTVYINDDGYERKEMVQENEIDGFIHCLKVLGYEEI